MVRQSTIPRPPVHRITAVQLALALVLSGIVYFTRGGVDSYSLLTGCSIQIAGTAYFAFRAFRYRGARQLSAVVAQMYRGASGKILVSAALFAVVFAFVRPLSAFFVFAGYLLMQVVQIVISAMVLPK